MGIWIGDILKVLLLTMGRKKKAPVRMQIGYQVGEGDAGAGFTHISRRRKNFLQGKNYPDVEAAVYDVLGNIDFAVKENDGENERIKVTKDLSPRTSVMLVMDLVREGNEDFYTVISLVPQSKQQIAREKNKALFFNGSVRPLAASGSGAFFTPIGSNAGTEGDSVARKNSASDTISISEADKYVNQFTYEGEEKHNQTAYHGSPHTFDSFDLGAIGTGEGAQANSLYNQSVRGQTKISGMSRVVSLFESADKSTFVHELGHVALADLKMLAEMEGAPAQLVRDWQTVKEWLGYKDSQGFTREQHEKFARGFEAYLRSGEAPVRGLRSVFRKFKKCI